MISFLKSIYVGLVYLFLYLPLAVMAAYSFNASKYSLSWKGFTLKWYGKLLSNTTLLDAAVRSMTIAIASATVACIIGTLVAFMLHQYRFKGRKAVFGGVFVMMMSPDIVIAISLLVLFLGAGFTLGFWTLLMGISPFAYRSSSPRSIPGSKASTGLWSMRPATLEPVSTKCSEKSSFPWQRPVSWQAGYSVSPFL